MFEMGMPATHDDMEFIEHRVYHDYVGTVDYDQPDSNMDPNSFDRNWVPYE